MPLVGRTKVFIEDLDTTYARLRPLFAPQQPEARRRKAARG
jgi:hypothetical protein